MTIDDDDDDDDWELIEGAPACPAHVSGAHLVRLALDGPLSDSEYCPACGVRFRRRARPPRRTLMTICAHATAKETRASATLVLQEIGRNRLVVYLCDACCERMRFAVNELVPLPPSEAPASPKAEGA